MSDSILINDVAVPVARLSCFEFSLHSSDPADEARAVLHVEDTDGGVLLVSGPEAVTLKVLLASIGIPGRSQQGIPFNEPATKSRPDVSPHAADFPPDG